MSDTELAWVAATAAVAFAVVVVTLIVVPWIWKRDPVPVIAQALAFVMVAGALAAGGYVVARGVAAVDRSAATVSGPTSGSISVVYSGSNSGGTASTSSPPSSDPTTSTSAAAGHAFTLGLGGSTGPSSQVGATDPAWLLPELMVFVLVFAALGVTLMVGGVPRGRRPRQY